MVNIIIKPDYTSTFLIECDINSNIHTIKDKIKEKLFIDDSKYHLIFSSKLIKDNELTLNNLGVKDFDTIQLYYINQETNVPFTIDDSGQIDEIQYNAIMVDCKYSLEFKFELIKCAIKNMTKLSKDTSGPLYSYLYLFSPEQIDKLYQLEPNNYWFFRYLPSVELINKYWSKDSNKFHGLTKNVVISEDERRQLIKKYLI